MSQDKGNLCSTKFKHRILVDNLFIFLNSFFFNFLCPYTQARIYTTYINRKQRNFMISINWDEIRFTKYYFAIFYNILKIFVARYCVKLKSCNFKTVCAVVASQKRGYSVTGVQSYKKPIKFKVLTRKAKFCHAHTKLSFKKFIILHTLQKN